MNHFLLPCFQMRSSRKIWIEAPADYLYPFKRMKIEILSDLLPSTEHDTVGRIQNQNTCREKKTWRKIVQRLKTCRRTGGTCCFKSGLLNSDWQAGVPRPNSVGNQLGLASSSANVQVPSGSAQDNFSYPALDSSSAYWPAVLSILNFLDEKKPDTHVRI